MANIDRIVFYDIEAVADAIAGDDAVPDEDASYVSYVENTEHTVVPNTLAQLERMEELAELFPALYILSEYPDTVFIETNSAAERVVAIGFPAKCAVFMATHDHDDLLIVVFGADDSRISVFTLAGVELMRGELPQLPDGWIWQEYALFGDGPFTIYVDSRNATVDGTPAEDDPENACLFEIFMNRC
jgi:hypothetical protein